MKQDIDKQDIDIQLDIVKARHQKLKEDRKKLYEEHFTSIEYEDSYNEKFNQILEKLLTEEK